MTGPLIEYLDGQNLAGITANERAILTQVRTAVRAAQEDLAIGRTPGVVVYERETVQNRDLQELVTIAQPVGGRLPNDALITDLRHPYAGKKWFNIDKVNPDISSTIIAEGSENVDYRRWHGHIRVNVPYPYPDWNAMMEGLTKGEQDKIKHVLGRTARIRTSQERYSRHIPPPVKTVGELRSLTEKTILSDLNSSDTTFLKQAFAQPQVSQR